MVRERAKEQKEIVVQHFNELAPFYDEKANQRLVYLAAIDALIIKRLKEKKGLKLLDVGCGTGLRTALIAKQLQSPQVYGIDIAQEMVEQAKKRIPAVQQTNMVSFNLQREFDAIFCLFNCFGYLGTYYERISALKNIQKHLKKEGLLFIDVMNARHKGEGLTFNRTNLGIIKEFLYSLLNPKLGIGNKLFTITLNNQNLQGFVHGFFDIEMVWLLQKSGFNIEKRYIIGYETGEIKQHIAEGQLFYICKKK